MTIFDNYFTSFINTESPPVITKEYEDTRSNYDYLTGRSEFPTDNFLFPSSFSYELPTNLFKDFDETEDWPEQLEETQQIASELPTILQNTSNTAKGIIDLARSFVGGRYILGHANPKTRTFDCSGLMNYVFGQYGIRIPRTTKALNRDGHRISQSLVRPGDLALFIPKGQDHGHVGLVAAVNGDTFTMIDARGKKYGIVQREIKKSSVTSFLRYLPSNGQTLSVPLQIQQSVTQVSNRSSKFSNNREYTRRMYQIFYNELEKQGINGSQYAPLLVAHSALESAWGLSGLSRNANNFGGIKGKGYIAMTKEADKNGNYYSKKASFKSYASIEDFAKDYVYKLKNRFGAFNVSPNLYVALIRSKGYFTAPLSKYQNSFNSVLNRVNKYIQNG